MKRWIESEIFGLMFGPHCEVGFAVNGLRKVDVELTIRDPNTINRFLKTNIPKS